MYHLQVVLPRSVGSKYDSLRPRCYSSNVNILIVRECQCCGPVIGAIPDDSTCHRICPSTTVVRLVGLTTQANYAVDQREHSHWLALPQCRAKSQTRYRLGHLAPSSTSSWCLTGNTNGTDDIYIESYSYKHIINSRMSHRGAHAVAVWQRMPQHGIKSQLYNILQIRNSIVNLFHFKLTYPLPLHTIMQFTWNIWYIATL